MNKEILLAIKEQGLLLDKDVFEVVSNISDNKIARELLERLARLTGQKLITKSVLSQHAGFVKEVASQLPGEQRCFVERTFIKLGLQVEVKKEREIIENKNIEAIKGLENLYRVFYAGSHPDKKIEVNDFVGYFRARYQQLQRILMRRPELQGLISINKLGGERKNASVIGIVSEKRVTKNKNLIICLEDLTGRVNVLARRESEEIYSIAEELQLDDVIGVKGNGNSDFLFAHNIIFPDSFVEQKVKFEEDICVAFVSDLHCGSSMHLRKNFEKFLDWLNGEDETAKKVRYLFFIGDNVDGVGIFPNQENVLELKSMEEQYSFFVDYLKKIPKRIVIFVGPGQHDACRVAEPQPLISKKYASGLYEIENAVLVTNPCMVKLIEGQKEFKVFMYHGASIHTFINEIKELRLMKAHKCPAKAVIHMLKRRHLSPTHGSASGIYIPYNEIDPLVINEVPDVFCTGEVHRLDVENYHGTLIITGSCWQSKTPYEEKVGNEPDPCKVPVLNLKTRELKVFDFSDKEKDKEKND